MPPIDPNIILGLRPAQIQQPDPFERYAKVAGIQAAMGQQELQGLHIQQARQAMEEEAQTKQAFSQAGGDRPSAIRALYGMGLHKPALALEKAGLEEEAKRATIRKDTAAAKENELKIATDEVSRTAAILSTANDQPTWDSARRQIAVRYGAEAIAKMPEQFDGQWLKSKLAEGQTYKDKLEDERARLKEAREAANQPFLPSGAPNPAYQQYKFKERAAGRPTVSVAVSTEKKYGEQFAGKIAGSDAAKLEAAEKAPEYANRAIRVLNTLESGKVITGAGADTR